MLPEDFEDRGSYIVLVVPETMRSALAPTNPVRPEPSPTKLVAETVPDTSRAVTGLRILPMPTFPPLENVTNAPGRLECLRNRSSVPFTDDPSCPNNHRTDPAVSNSIFESLTALILPNAIPAPPLDWLT